MYTLSMYGYPIIPCQCMYIICMNTLSNVHGAGGVISARQAGRRWRCPSREACGTRPSRGGELRHPLRLSILRGCGGRGGVRSIAKPSPRRDGGRGGARIRERRAPRHRSRCNPMSCLGYSGHTPYSRDKKSLGMITH